MRISIVTPSYNQGLYLENTILSILEQGFLNLEYIIIDGGSTDNSVEIIKRYSKFLKFWVSEKDCGQSDAINKGLLYCTGDIFNWINSDDVMTPGSLQIINDSFDNSDALAGQVEQFEVDSNNVYIKENFNISAETLILDPPETCFHQPGIWLNLEKLRSIGLFRTDMHYSFDQEFYIRYLSKFPNIKYLDDILVRFRLHKNSKTVSCSQCFLQEQRNILIDISNDHTNISSDLKAIARDQLFWLKWKDELKQSRFKGGFFVFLGILKKMIFNPKRINRYSLGTLKAIFLGK